MKKTYKVIIICLILLALFSLVYKVKATDIWQIGKDFLDTGKTTVGMSEESKHIVEALGGSTKSKFEELIDFLWGIGLLVIFISTVIIGIKYMLVLPQEKSRLKQATTPYIIGVIIIFGALTIWKFIIVVLDGSL